MKVLILNVLTHEHLLDVKRENPERTIIKCTGIILSPWHAELTQSNIFDQISIQSL